MFGIDWSTLSSSFESFALFVAGMVVYSLAVFKFYKRASKHILFELTMPDLKNSKHPALKKFWIWFVYLLKYLFLSPLIFFVWLVVITLLLLLFTSSTPTATILLIGMSLLATIRITAYYDENLAVDVAKTLPLSMLAAFLLDVDRSIDLKRFWDKLLLVPSFYTTLILYFLFIVGLEFILRVFDAITKRQ